MSVAREVLLTFILTVNGVSATHELLYGPDDGRAAWLFALLAILATATLTAALWVREMRRL